MWTRTRLAGPIAALVLLNAGWAFGQSDLPKVPFKNKPCEALSAEDLAAIKIPTPVKTMTDRAPGQLPFDNSCSYLHDGNMEFQVSYLTKGDYDANSSGNRSKSSKAPGDLPGAFYAKQGVLWIAKNGYYVAIEGHEAMREAAARVLAKKL